MHPRNIRTYDEYWSAVCDCRIQLDISLTLFDELAGFPEGYSSKLFGPGRKRLIGPRSFGLILPAIGCKLVLVEDQEALERIKSQLVPRVASNVRQRIIEPAPVSPFTRFETPQDGCA
jgi:hypothetical protein